MRHSAFVRCADIFWRFLEKKPAEYFSIQAESLEMQERLQDAMYQPSRLDMRDAKRQLRQQLNTNILPGGVKRATMVAAVGDMVVHMS